MILVALSIFDTKAECFNNPFFTRTLAEGIRSFNDAPNVVHREDYVLYRVGAFDDSTGAFVPNDVPLRICSLSETSI